MITVTRMDDGSWISWGRHSAWIYRGEDAKVLDMLLSNLTSPATNVKITPET